MKSTIVNCNVNRRSEMKSYTLKAILATLFALGLVACANGTDTTIKGTPNVNADTDNNVAVWDADQCYSDEDCDFDQTCKVNAKASKELGFEVSRCEKGCSAEYTTVLNEDGTSVTKKDGDTCQRFGDETVYCDPTDKVCVEYTTETPVEPEDPPEEPAFIKVHCCFNAQNLMDGTYYAQLAWSTSTVDDPQNYGSDGNLTLDENGCFTSTSKVERGKYYRGFWTELTRGMASTDNWLGAGDNGEYAPISCEVDDVSAAIGTDHVQGCGIGLFDSVNEDGTTSACK